MPSGTMVEFLRALGHYLKQLGAEEAAALFATASAEAT